MTEAKNKVRDLLAKAEEEKASNLPVAVATLHEAAKLISIILHEADNQERASLRNTTTDPKIIIVHYFTKKGNIHYEIGEYEEALRCYKEAKGHIPGVGDIYKPIGDCLRKKGKFEEALAIYEEGLEVFADNPPSDPKKKAALLSSKGLLFLNMGKKKEAVDAFDEAAKIAKTNPLYWCHKGQALHALYENPTNEQEQSYLACFTKAQELAATQKIPEGKIVDQNGLTQENLNFINKTLSKFLDTLTKLKEIDVQNDEFMKVIEDHHISLAIEGIQTQTEVPSDKIIAVKLNLKELKQSPNLALFYDGFMYTMSQSYLTATLIERGAFTLDTGDLLTTGASKLISMIPLIGNQISTAFDTAKTFIKTALLTKSATNVAIYATEQGQFNQFVLDAAVEIMNLRKKEIESLQKMEAHELSKWKRRFHQLWDMFKRAEDVLYGTRMKTPMQKLGSNTASDLCSDWLGSGKLLQEGEFSPLVPDEEKTKRMFDCGLKLLDQMIKEAIADHKLKVAGDVQIGAETADNQDLKTTNKDNQNKIIPTAQLDGGKAANPAVVEKKSKCCQIF